MAKSYRFSIISLFILLSFLSVNSSWADSQKIQSHYTSIQESDCKKPADAVVALYDKRGLSVQECPGTGAWKVFFVSSDARSWLDISSGNQFWSTEQQVVYKNEFGNFPNVGDEKLEWRTIVGGKPVGLIFKIIVQDQNDANKSQSRLFVLKLGENTAMFCGVAKKRPGAYIYISQKDKCTTELTTPKS